MMKKIFLLSVFAVFFLCNAASEQILRVVTSADFPPYEYHEGDKIVGIDIDILREVLRRGNCKMVVEDMKFDSIIAAVQTGKGDIAASAITITEDRKKMVDFSIPYITAKQVIIVPENSKVQGVSDLKGLRIGVQHGTTGDSYVTEKIGEPQRFSDASMAVAALNRNKLDVVVLDNDPAMVHVAKNPQLKILEKPLTFEEYAFAVPKGRQELLKMINDGLTGMHLDKTIVEIVDKYNERTQKSVDSAQEDAASGFKADFYTNFVKNERWRYLVDGFIVTISVAFSSVILGVLIGFVVAIIRSTADQTGKFKIADFVCRVYLTVIRGTPVVLQLLIIYFVVFGSVDVDKIMVAILAFGINSGAYVAEIIRSGIMSIDRGQMEAGRSLGLNYSQTMGMVILPQALKNVLPALGNEFIVLLKETSVCGFIALQDLTKGGDIIRSQTYNAFQPLIAVALVYLVMVVIFSKLLEILEKRLKKNE
ncbi:MAG: transporter substrate-binding domain-containing protein [Lentisphaerae bacterium]|nr:transporter substrate-binding domain-containing protein [Lentisphaerota bacterium]